MSGSRPKATDPSPDLDDLDSGWDDEAEDEEEDVDAGWGDGPPEPEEPAPVGETPEQRVARLARIAARAEERKQRQRAKAAEKAERRRARAAAGAAKQKKSARKPGSTKPRPQRVKPARRPASAASDVGAVERESVTTPARPVARARPGRPWLPTAILVAILVVAGAVAFWLYRR